MPTRQRISGPPLRRAVSAEATVVDKDKRIVRLSFSSEEALVERYSYWDDPWLERLGHNDDEVDLEFLNSGGAPVLWGHDRWSRTSMVGVIEKAWLEKGRAYAEVRLSARDDVEGLQLDIVDGIVRNVSVGYQILERELVKQNKNAPNEYRVTSWKPLEISFVPIPADEGVGVGRSDDAAQQQRYTVTTIEERIMPDIDKGKPAAPANEQQRQENPAAVDTNTRATETVLDAAAVRAAAEEAVRADRLRTEQIRGLVRTHGLGDTFESTALTSTDTIEQVRAKALDELAKRETPHHPRMSAGADQRDKQRDAAVSWLLYRGNERIDAEKLNGNTFRGMSLVDMVRHCYAARGGNPMGLTNTELVERAISHSTSDFPIILQNVMHKTLEAAYTAIPFVWREFCAVGNLADFRPHYRYRMGSFGNLAEVKENGAFTYGTLSDAERESITAKTKGKLLNISRQMIINDDLGAFLNLTREMGQGAARTIEDDVFTLLLANPNTGDGGALFNATAVTTPGGHANLNASGAAPTVAGFDTARQAMATQKNVGGTDYISVSPAIWLGPVALSGQAKVVNEAQYDIDQSNKQNYPNKSRGLVQKIVESPRLTGNQWYFFADPRISAVLEVGFLNGQQTPYSEMQQGFEVDGVTWKIRHDYGVAAVGYRGAHKVTW
jgi:hypothetical protein